MAKKGILHLFLVAFLVALLSFFILYFFAPNMSSRFLGVSFSSRKGVSTVETRAVPSFAQDSLDALEQLQKSPLVQEKIVDAVKQGGDLIKDAGKALTDSVR